MFSLSDTSDFSKHILKWYKTHKRDLPWRENNNPYNVWLSEIILQQTRIEQGIPYYYKLLDAFPDIKSLAEAPSEVLFKLWQGLGYYSRAKNMHTAAREVMSKHAGQFPQDYEGLRALKGIGPYTSAAIGSICFHLPKAVVDGNVYRVLARYYAIDTPINSSLGQKTFQELAELLLDQKQPGMYNQAIMDFGAIQCTPNKPDCESCPFMQTCAAYKTDQVQLLPVKTKNKPKITRYLYYFYIFDGSNTWIQKRMGKDIWENLWEFPMLETPKSISTDDIMIHDFLESHIQDKYQVNHIQKIKHLLTHQILEATIMKITVPESFVHPKQWTKIKSEDLHLYAIPRLLDKYLEKEIK